jgi:hypothetical protein
MQDLNVDAVGILPFGKTRQPCLKILVFAPLELNFLPIQSRSFMILPKMRPRVKVPSVTLSLNSFLKPFFLFF